jgi:hypothetical protein
VNIVGKVHQSFSKWLGHRRKGKSDFLCGGGEWGEAAEREREGEKRKWVCACEREREREREKEIVCVCVCERERGCV